MAGIVTQRFKPIACVAGISYECWYPSWLSHFWSGSLLICLREQWEMSQVHGLLHMGDSEGDSEAAPGA